MSKTKKSPKKKCPDGYFWSKTKKRCLVSATELLKSEVTEKVPYGGTAYSVGEEISSAHPSLRYSNLPGIAREVDKKRGKKKKVK